MNRGERFRKADPNDPLERLRSFSDDDLLFERRDIVALFVHERAKRAARDGAIRGAASLLVANAADVTSRQRAQKILNLLDGTERA